MVLGLVGPVQVSLVSQLRGEVVNVHLTDPYLLYLSSVIWISDCFAFIALAKLDKA